MRFIIAALALMAMFSTASGYRPNKQNIKSAVWLNKAQQSPPLSNLFNQLWGKKEMNILMVGLDGAGKTTILNKLNMGQIVTTRPAMGFNVETVNDKNIGFTSFDLGGRDNSPFWRFYLQNVQGLIFVVDSNARERIGEAKEELNKMLNIDELRDAPLLVFANKQDLPNAMNAPGVSDRLGLNYIRQKNWNIQATDATSGDGLYEGFNWLLNELKKQRNVILGNAAVDRLKSPEPAAAVQEGDFTMNQGDFYKELGFVAVGSFSLAFICGLFVMYGAFQMWNKSNINNMALQENWVSMDKESQVNK